MTLADVTPASVIQIMGAVLAVVLGIASIIAIIAGVKIYYKSQMNKQKETRDLTELQLSNERIKTLTREIEIVRAQAKADVEAEKRRGEDTAEKFAKLVDVSAVTKLLETTSGKSDKILGKLSESIIANEKRAEERHRQQTSVANATVATLDSLAQIVSQISDRMHDQLPPHGV